jgi:Na+/H+-dicarboxylate symporter
MAWTRHPLTLVGCLAAGALLGAFSPSGSALAQAVGVLALVGRLFGQLMDMAALPLLVVAVTLGLRTLQALPHRGRRLAQLLLTALGLLWACGLLGAFAGHWAGVGRDLDEAQRRTLGLQIQRAGGAAERLAIDLRGPSEPPAEFPSLPAEPGHDAPVGAPPGPSTGPATVNLDGPRLDNAFAALVRGDLPAVLACTLLFALAMAALERAASQALAQQLEAVYRTLEQLIAQALHLLPLLAFGLAAHLAASVDAELLSPWGRLIATLAVGTLAVAALALPLLARSAGCSLRQALAALRAALLIGLLAPSATAAIPATIDALSRQLGLSRGLTELLVPSGAVFLRAGLALHTALIAVFTAGLYGLPTGLGDLLWIGTLAAAAALWPAPLAAAGPLTAVATVLLWLRLPSEGLLPVLLLADRLCAGLRQVVALLGLAALCEIGRAHV